MLNIVPPLSTSPSLYLGTTDPLTTALNMHGYPGRPRIGHRVPGQVC